MLRTWTRRRVLAGTGALVTGTTGSIVVLTDRASATVDGEFSVPNGEAVLTDQTLQDVKLRADATYSVDANAPVHGVELELHVGASASTLDMIARHTRSDLGTDQLSGEQTLQGSIVGASDYSIDNFQPTDGELTTGVVAELRLFVLRNGSVVAEARQSEAFDVIVSEQSLEVTTTLGGTGEVLFNTS